MQPQVRSLNCAMYALRIGTHPRTNVLVDALPSLL